VGLVLKIYKVRLEKIKENHPQPLLAKEGR
jgi:hypothetical protein